MKTNIDPCWLRYEKVREEEQRQQYLAQCASIIHVRSSELLETARQELLYGLQAMLGREPVEHSLPGQGTGRIVLGVAGDSPLLDQVLNGMDAGADEEAAAKRDAYCIQSGQDAEGSYIALAGLSERGVLYAVFHFLRVLQMRGSLESLSLQERPANRLRMINQWDNMDGSIERGYAGRSIFYHNNSIVSDLSRVTQYARLLSSVGINVIAINNVNVHEHETLLISDQLLPEVESVAAVFRQYGIQLYLSINYSSPIQLGGLSTADPLAEEVRNWWAERVRAIYKIIPDFGGFLVKADSENRPGPFTYGRNHVDGANMLAGALEPFGGVVIWRCFVYNCHQDWRDRSTDRARAAYDHFMPLDGQFKSNVILQIKNGPMDFQVREPVSPLLGGLEKTNQLLELQITQEYTGQQRHLCYLVPQWKTVLDFDTCARGKDSTVAKAASGELYDNTFGGMAAVSNIGNELNWTGHDLAQANLYGYGRLSWNYALSAEEITKEWVQRTYGVDPGITATISNILLDSWGIYESYTSPLGVGWMVNPEHHYGPNVDGYEYSKWGTYHFADCLGLGVDRTAATGTGYTSQYYRENAAMYEQIETCPDELLLFFHHVPYRHRLKSGKSVIQHIYDTHFEGVLRAQDLVRKWEGLEDRLEPDRYQRVLTRLQEQAAHAAEWRDRINTYFLRKSGIEDELHREIHR